MIDKDWLDESLRFPFPGGDCMAGVVGVGGFNIAIGYNASSGEQMVIKMDKNLFNFACYIHEVPNWIAPSPRYDVAQLNAKLSRALGDPLALLMIPSYAGLIENMIDWIWSNNWTDLEHIEGEIPETTELIQFVIRTPMFAYRLAEACDSTNRDVRMWAIQAADTLDRSDKVVGRLAPSTIADNPIILWGGAASHGYFTDEEFPLAVAAVESHLARQSADQAEIFCDQAGAILNVLTAFGDAGAGTGLALLCYAFGWTEDVWATAAEIERRVTFQTAMDLSWLVEDSASANGEDPPQPGAGDEG